MSKIKEKSIPVKVVVRVRPLNDAEILRGSRVIVECPLNKKEIIVKERPSDKITKKFTFDRVFGYETKQIDVYKAAASPLIKEVLDGYNCTIFAYGQTGAGKTYTMEGRRSSSQSLSWTTDVDAGIIPRAVDHMFDELRALGAEFLVKASYLEIYNEEIFDLLSPIDDTTKLRLYEDAVKKGAVFVHGLDEVAVTNKQEVYAVLDRGARKRQTAATLMNATSSRSHTVFSITVRIKENGVDDDEMLRTGKLNFVDLAGSENIGRSGAVEKRAREAGNINQSLLTLGRVITALVEKTPHIPYRESKLTRLLQESLGGRTKTCIIATVSPSYCNMEETLSTLDYAHRAKNIQNKPEVNLKIRNVTVIQDYILEIQQLKAALTAAREKDGVYLAQDNYNEIMMQIERQRCELSGLLTNMKTLTEAVERKEEMNRELSESLANYVEELQRTKSSLEESEILLKHHVDTEDTLSKQAADLLSVANTATCDVNLLHETLLRKRNIEANNLTAYKNITGFSKQKLYNLKELLSNYENCELKSNQEIMNIIGETKKRTEQQTQKMKEEVDGALDTSANILKIIQDSTNSVVSEANRMVETTKSESQESFESYKEIFITFMNNLVQKVQQVSTELIHYEAENRKIIESIVLKVEDQKELINQHYSSVSQEIQKATNNIQKQESILLKAAENLKEHKAYIAREKSSFLQTVETFFRHADAAIDVEVENIETSLATLGLTTSNLKKLKDEEECIKNESELCEADIQMLLLSNREMALPVVNNIKCVNSEICHETAQQKSAFTEKQGQYLDAVHQNLNSISEILVKHENYQSNKMEEMHNQTQEFSVAHKCSLEQTKEEQILSCSECTSLISRNNEHIKLLHQTTTEEISECLNTIEHFTTEKVLEDTPSGRTPERRDFVYPTELASTSPHERILCRFRAAKIEDTLLEQNASSSGNSSDSLQESAVCSYSGMENSQMSACEMQSHFQRCASKSSSSIFDAPNPLSVPFKSEPNIPIAMLGKENSSAVPLPSVKQHITKRQVLTEHNE